MEDGFTACVYVNEFLPPPRKFVKLTWQLGVVETPGWWGGFFALNQGIFTLCLNCCYETKMHWVYLRYFHRRKKNYPLNTCWCRALTQDAEGEEEEEANRSKMRLILSMDYLCDVTVWVESLPPAGGVKFGSRATSQEPLAKNLTGVGEVCCWTIESQAYGRFGRFVSKSWKA